MKILVRVEKPLGPPDPISPSFGVWRTGTTRAVKCEICGTNHPEIDQNDDPYHTANFLGNQVVSECCGKIFDLAYLEMGSEFGDAKLNEFAQNPTSGGFFLSHIATCIAGAKKKLQGTSEVIGQISTDLGEMTR